MNSNPSSGLQNRRIKPTLDTRFHIDYQWWDRQSTDLRTYLLSFVPEERRSQFQDLQTDSKLDWVDPTSAEVKQIDAYGQALRDTIDDASYSQMPLVDAVFKVFVLNGNSPLSPNELESIVERPAKTILRTLAGNQVYRGLRPFGDD